MRLGDEFECHFKLRVPDVSSFFFTREMEHVSVKATARILHFDLIFNFWFFPFFFFAVDRHASNWILDGGAAPQLMEPQSSVGVSLDFHCCSNLDFVVVVVVIVVAMN